jgi:hypothetical protein
MPVAKFAISNIRWMFEKAFNGRRCCVSSRPPRGRKFKSSHPDQKSAEISMNFSTFAFWSK